MATDLTDIADLAVWPTFQRKVRSAMITACVNVGAETLENTNYSATRHALVPTILSDIDAWTAKFSWAVASNTQITYTTTDTDIQWTVNSVWDAMAGAGPAPTVAVNL